MNWIPYPGITKTPLGLFEEVWRIKKMENPIKVQSKINETEALQWTKNNEPFIRAFIKDDSKIHFLGSELQIWNSDNRSWNAVPMNHWIIKGIKGEFYPCSPEVFSRSYEEVGYSDQVINKIIEDIKSEEKEKQTLTSADIGELPNDLIK